DRTDLWDPAATGRFLVAVFVVRRAFRGLVRVRRRLDVASGLLDPRFEALPQTAQAVRGGRARSLELVERQERALVSLERRDEAAQSRLEIATRETAVGDLRPITEHERRAFGLEPERPRAIAILELLGHDRETPQRLENVPAIAAGACALLRAAKASLRLDRPPFAQVDLAELEIDCRQKRALAARFDLARRLRVTSPRFSELSHGPQDVRDLHFRRRGDRRLIVLERKPQALLVAPERPLEVVLEIERVSYLVEDARHVRPVADLLELAACADVELERAVVISSTLRDDREIPQRDAPDRAFCSL